MTIFNMYWMHSCFTVLSLAVLQYSLRFVNLTECIDFSERTESSLYPILCCFLPNANARLALILIMS